MLNREKVIKGLEICTSRPCYCTDCPYKKGCVLDSQEVMEDALKLLKEQEPVKPRKILPCITRPVGGYVCGHCGIRFLEKNDYYCPNCGKAVKWDDI